MNSSSSNELKRRFGGLAMGAGLIAVLAGFVWYLLAGTASTKREVAATPMLMLPPPPPPPPEPEKLPEPEPEVEPEVTEPDPTPMDQPPDEAPPSPQQDFNDPVTIAGEAQAGTDAYGTLAGRGGGMSGTGGLGSGSYGRYVSSVLQQALARDSRTRHLTFRDLQLELWLDADGRTKQVKLLKSTGNAAIDEAVLAMLRDIERIDERPPASMTFPMHIAMTGRRP